MVNEGPVKLVLDGHPIRDKDSADVRRVNRVKGKDHVVFHHLAESRNNVADEESAIPRAQALTQGHSERRADEGRPE